jgi:hypothetical protein
MVKILTIGSRSIYNPVHYQIKELYADKDWLIIDLMYTWDYNEALKQLKQKRFGFNKVIIDGVGWKNLGNKPVLDWQEIGKTEFEQKEDYQVAKITKGCPHNCPYCYSDDFEYLGIPKFNRNLVKLTDENLLATPNVIEVLKELKDKKVNRKVIKFEAICGFDFRYLNKKVAKALKKARFINPRVAWDYGMEYQSRVKYVIKTLKSVGYKDYNGERSISVFMLTNWDIPIEECFKKLLKLWEWRVKVDDCCFNCSYKNPIPHGWTLKEIKNFRKIARKHNQLVMFNGYDPEIHRYREHPLLG